jgi:aminoglycoside phosphotransferase family enzyme/predicted kinase
VGARTFTHRAPSRETDTAELVTAMSSPRFYPGHPPVAVRETHGSWVFLAGERAYKVKKPVRYPFMDYSTLEQRHAACVEEVRVNRPLAPDLYLGVRPILRRRGSLALGGLREAHAVEYAVEMLRFDERTTLAARLAAGTATCSDARAVGRAVADFHARAEIVAGGGAPAVQARLDRDLEELLGLVRGGPRVAALGGLERFGQAFVLANAAEMDARARAGLVRDGHGDLRTDHVLLEPRLTLLDRIEFDASLRRVDVAADLAFLLMDLEHSGAQAQASALLSAYREAGGDAGDDRLLAFHSAHRALVRAKVALLSDREREADALLALAQRFAWRTRLPLALVVCGPSASGKSTLAARLGARSALPVVASDVTRKRLAGLPATARAAAHHYSREMDTRTYAELARTARAEARVAHGAIIDATFRRAGDRALLRAAFGEMPLVWVQCAVPREEQARRAAARLADSSRISDATPAVAALQARTFEPLDEVAPGDHLLVRTDCDPEVCADEVEALLDARTIRSGACARRSTA